MDGDLGGLGERRRWHVRGGGACARLSGALRPGGDRVSARERSHLARRLGDRPRRSRRAGAPQPLRALVRRRQGAGDVPAVRGGPAELPDRLLERPGRGDGDRRRAAGLAGGSRADFARASGGRRGHPAADPDRLSGLLARGGGRWRGWARRAPGGGPRACPDVRGGRDGRGRWRVAGRSGEPPRPPRGTRCWR
jgi:hypothetical protein